jgi:hypothetical protein
LLEQKSPCGAFDLGQVGKPHVHVSLEQTAQKGNAAGKAVDLADHKRAAMEAGGGKRAIQFRAIGFPAALNFSELGGNAPVAARSQTERYLGSRQGTFHRILRF